MKPVKIAILWHMHQPDYRDATSSHMVLPWVRLHALKDYLDMPLLASKFSDVTVTFNLVPALLDQLELYTQGADDPHLALTKIESDKLTVSEKEEILKTFFSAPHETMIRPYKRYFELYKKAQSISHDKITISLFSSQEIRDIQLWSNLTWIDPIFRTEKIIAKLFHKERNFTEQDKEKFLIWQLEHLKKILPTYQKLYKEKKIDISFTPYYHPILPLLCDSDSAKEALPHLTLPKHRFMHPEDADKQIAMSVNKFQELFGSPLQGMWPSEGSVSETAAMLIDDNKIQWIATDEEILYNSLLKYGMDSDKNHPYQLYKYNNLCLFFRDHALSDRVGFVYSGMESKQAVDDFIEHLYNIRERFVDNLDNIVIPVILDGENAWEYFENDGKEFLELLYERLHKDELIEAVGMSDCAKTLQAVELPSLFAGSWINHNFKIWIGHAEDNRAWDLLYDARKFLVQFENENPDFDTNLIKQAWEKIYIAEGSDWCWWYGDEHRGAHNKEFDLIFRNHLGAVYSLLQTEIPAELKIPITSSDAINEPIMPDGLIFPTIDGKRTHFYEWGEAGSFDVADDGGAMHRVSKQVEKIQFGFDHDNLYFRIQFNSAQFKPNSSHKLVVEFSHLNNFNIEILFGKYDTIQEKEFSYAFKEDLEIAINRQSLLPNGFGKILFTLSLSEGENKIETIPDSKPIEMMIPQKGQEMFWPMF